MRARLPVEPVLNAARQEPRTDQITNGPSGAASRQPEHERTLLIEVRSAADNKPLPGAAVWARVSGGQSHEPTVGHTDGTGHYSIELGEGPIASFTVVAAAEGYVPKELRFGAENIPANPVMGLERGVQIGGRVVDEQGRPIQAARVMPSTFLTAGDEVAAALTDAQGRWQSHALAASAVADKKADPLEFRLSHPDYTTEEHEIAPDQRALGRPF